MKLLQLLIVLLCPLGLSATESDLNLIPWGNFENIKINEIAQGGQKGIIILDKKGRNQSSCVFLPNEKSLVCALKQIEIKPLTKYRLSFWGKIDDQEFYLKDIAPNQIVWKDTQELPTWSYLFYNLSLKWINVGAQPSFDQKIISNDWMLYQSIFYTPKDANLMKISFSNGKNPLPLLVDDISLEELKNDAVININPDFSLGPYNYSGYKFMKNAWIKEKEGEPGKYELDATEGFVIGDAIPLSPGKYSLEIAGRKGDNKKAVTTFFIDYHSFDTEKEKSDMKKPSFFRFDDKKMQTQTYDFVISPGIDFICMRFAWGIFDSVKIKKTQDR